MAECEGCQKAYKEVKTLEKIVDNRYIEYKDMITEYKVDKAEQLGMLKAIHKRMDNQAEEQKRLNDNLIHHMEEEGTHHIEVKEHMATTNEILLHLAPLEALEKVRGRQNTMWIIGGTVVAAMLSTMIYFITYIKTDLEEDLKKNLATTKNEINLHSTTASKANYHGLARVVRKEVRDAK